MRLEKETVGVVVSVKPAKTCTGKDLMNKNLAVATIKTEEGYVQALVNRANKKYTVGKQITLTPIADKMIQTTVIG